MKENIADRQERTIGVRACIPANKQSDVGDAHRGVEEAAMETGKVQGGVRRLNERKQR